jgi:hypothetical protein
MPEGMAVPRAQVCSEDLAGQAAKSNAAWLAFIHYCQQLGHGEIEKLKIQDGLPVLAEQAFKKIKFQ